MMQELIPATEFVIENHIKLRSEKKCITVPCLLQQTSRYTLRLHFSLLDQTWDGYLKWKKVCVCVYEVLTECLHSHDFILAQSLAGLVVCQSSWIEEPTLNTFPETENYKLNCDFSEGRKCTFFVLKAWECSHSINLHNALKTSFYNIYTFFAVSNVSLKKWKFLYSKLST